jgi:uncharacterized protein YyaL (SSP411 family)
MDPKAKLYQHSKNTISILAVPDKETIKGLPPDGGPDFNRLVFEKSPYLLQHAANPVDWYPWGEEAFHKAEAEDKPVFLSIGYSTCHWCHVMEKESFEDSQVASLLNQVFVPIKVDREERPDIDQLYMSVCQAVTGTGGWPLTVILTPDKKPFFAGTYFPKESRFGRIGLTELIPKIDQLWKGKRGELLESADKILDYLQQPARKGSIELDESILEKAYYQLSGGFDPSRGGFGTAPKFPSPHNLLFLLRYWHRTGESRALEMVEKTLQEMRLGGIFDHVGFGFHRYSTDASWILPHFEKMLYDQAMLILAYVEAYQATGKTEYAQTAREVIDYILRDMTSPEGGFYSAEDADSEGEEGLFYLWETKEIQEYLGEGSELITKIFNLAGGGNFFDEGTKMKTGRNILYLQKPLKEYAQEMALEVEEFTSFWEKSRQLLFEVREKRIHPLKDDKILTDWNGLMVAALAKAAAALGEPGYSQAARNAVDFIWKNLRAEDGSLLKRYRDGEAGQPAHLDDYVFLIWGLIELYESELDPGFLEKALDLNDRMLEKFWDHDLGGLFLAAEDQTDLIVRSKEIYDGAIPSGNSVAALNLLKLGRLLSNPKLEEKAHQIGQVFSDQISQIPQGHTHFLSSLLFALGPTFEVVIAGVREAQDTDQLIKALQFNYLPNKVLLFRPEGEEAGRITNLAPFLESKGMVDGKAAAYVCRDYACKMPTSDPEKMLSLLKG